MLVELYLLALAVASISMTIAESKLFAPIRSKAEENGWFKKLISCVYCTSHYVAAITVIIYKPAAISIITIPGFNYVVVVFAVITLASFFVGLIRKAYQ